MWKLMLHTKPYVHWVIALCTSHGSLFKEIEQHVKTKKGSDHSVLGLGSSVLHKGGHADWY